MLTEPTTNLEKVVPEAHDFLPLLGTDHVQLIVGNAKQRLGNSNQNTQYDNRNKQLD